MGGGLRIGGQVERVDGRELRYEEFVERYLKPNRPVVLTGLMDGWRACADWVTPDARPNLPFFAAHFGKSMVQVADCCRKEFTDQKRQEMSVLEFVNHWCGHSEERCNNGLHCHKYAHSLLYLKDWHFVKEYPEYVAYTTPQFFIDDWLNLYLDSHCMHRDSDIHRDKNEINCADYRFVYMGAKGTWTPLHADVFRSYSWSANVCGKKLWLFLPPSQCHLVFDRNFKSSVYDVHDEISETQFPGFNKTIWLECTQEQHEIIFVPSGWYHQVLNLDDTVSINHNWFNAYNLPSVWNLLVKDYSDAKEYIEDIRDISDDFESLCQRNLAANTGMNFYDFFIFVTRFALANMIQLYCFAKEEDATSNPSKKAFFIRNLMRISAVASRMKSMEVFTGENLSYCSEENRSAFSDIKKILEEPDFRELCRALLRTYETIHDRGQRSFEKRNEQIHGKDCLLRNFSEECFGILDSIIAVGSKIHGPEDLVRLIDHALKSSIISANVDFSLALDLHDYDSLTVQ